MCYDVHWTPEHKPLPGVKYAEHLCLTCCSKSSLFSELSFCISTKCSWYARSENFRQIHCLAANWHSNLYRSEIMRNFANMDRIIPTRTRPWCQLTYSMPIRDFLSSFNLKTCSKHRKYIGFPILSETKKIFHKAKNHWLHPSVIQHSHYLSVAAQLFCLHFLELPD